MESTDCVVVGAGVVGLAIARALAQAGREVIILEAAEAIGTGISSRNSEVIHAGIYYPRGSLMARFCVPLRLAARALARSLGRAGTRRRGHLPDLDRRWPASPCRLSGAAGGQAGVRGSAPSAADAVIGGLPGADFEGV
jgi:glycine/D-amino acid oxidase-like deaminating enzyme